jgi:hypothetical protein
MAVRTAFFYVLWDDPPVYVITSGQIDGVSLALAVAAGRPCHLLMRPSWHIPHSSDQIARIDRWLKAHWPGVKLTCMAPWPEDVDHLAGLGVSAVHANNLAFIDEQIYFPEPGAPKLYDAVHNARTNAFKRHELALGVPNLALISYDSKVPGDNAPSVAEVASRYRHLAYVNRTEAGDQWLDGAATRSIVCRSRCGLMLSDVEGPNNASMEYFLCGVPLVSTTSKGGREAMYDPRHVVVVEPTQQAVEAAVASYVLSAPDPEEIRASALAKTRPHRRRLIAWLSGVVGEDLLPRADESLWLPQFCDKLREVWVLEDLGGEQAKAFRHLRPDRPRS